ncbi:MAG: sll1863 family stress response protein [Methylobacter sp.]
MKMRDAYVEKLAAELNEWSAQIDLLAAKAENAKADAKLQYAQALEELRSKQQEASEKIKELEEASDEAWESVKTTADTVWKDLKTGITAASAKFK